MRSHHLVVSFAALVAAQGSGPARAVVGPSQAGSPVAAGIVMVLQSSGREAGFCTGVVLAPTVVMTAAHCVPPGAELRVHFPEPGEAPVLLPVAGVMRHPGYRAAAIRTRQRSIDLALVHLQVSLPPRFKPLEVADRPGAAPGERFTLSGYGVADEGDPTSSGTLRSTDLAARAPASDVLLWAGDPAGRGAGACTGDSGAPVLRSGDGRVAALAVWSAGAGAARCGSLTQALWLAPERAWISGVIRSWESSR